MDCNTCTGCFISAKANNVLYVVEREDIPEEIKAISDCVVEFCCRSKVERFTNFCMSSIDYPEMQNVRKRAESKQISAIVKLYCGKYIVFEKIYGSADISQYILRDYIRRHIIDLFSGVGVNTKISYMYFISKIMQITSPYTWGSDVDLSEGHIIKNVLLSLEESGCLHFDENKEECWIESDI